MAFVPRVWQDLPSTSTPLSADDLNYMNTGIQNAAATADGALAALAAIAPGSPTGDLFQLGNGAASAKLPFNSMFFIRPADAAIDTLDVVPYALQSVFVGDWTPTASVVINATGGTAAWSIGGQTTNQAPGASAATVQTALQALSTVGSGNITVTGGPGGGGGGTPYVVKYVNPIAFASSGFPHLTVNGASLTGGAASAVLTWTNGEWGVDTGQVFGMNPFHVTGSSHLDGQGLIHLYGTAAEADLRSDATMGAMTGLLAEASAYGGTATGHVGSVTSMSVGSPAHKGGALPNGATADSVYGLFVGAVPGQFTFTDGVTTSGSPVITSALAAFNVNVIGKVASGAGIPAGAYVIGVTGSSITLSANCTATATAVAVTLARHWQATTAYTAWFGAGKVGMNGAVTITAWRPETLLTLTGFPSQTQDLESWNSFNAQVAHLGVGGAFGTQGLITSYEGVTGQMQMGLIGGHSAIAFGTGTPDVVLTRSAAGVLSLTAAAALQIGHAVTGSRPSPSTAGPGGSFYDSTLSKPIWSDGTAWRDSAGTAV